MTITTLILLLATGIVAVTAVDDCPSPSPPNINSCCELVPKQFFTFSRNVQNGSSGVYQLKNSVEMTVYKLRLIVTLAMEEEDG